MKNFRTFNLSAEFYKSIKNLDLPTDAKNQLDRAARSISLNLAEGSGKATAKDQRRFFQIAFGSLRECQAVFMLEHLEETEQFKLLDKLGAHLYKLIKNSRCGI